MLKNLCTGKNLLFSILAVLVLVLAVQIKEIVMLFFAAYVIACALNPVVAKLAATKLRRMGAAALVVGGSAFAVLSLFAPIFFIAFKEISSFVSFFSEKLSEISGYLTHFKLLGYRFQDFQ